MKKKFLSVGLLMLAILLLVPNLAFASSSNQSSSSGKVIDQFVDLGGYKIFTHTEGKQRGKKPTVVFESGFGQGHEAWRYVQPEVAKFTKTVSYDRTSLGQSDPTVKPRDAVGVATELHALLEKMDVQKPYILVGHSMGGQYIRVFQSLFPDDVAGLVLVDGTVDTFSTDIVPEFDPILQELYPASFNDPLLGLFSDVEASSTQARAARPMLRNVPLTVLCPEYQIGPMSPPEDHELLPLTNPEVTDAKWKQLQEGLVSESNFGKFVYVKESAHEINIYKPEVITKEIKLMFNKVK